MFRNLHPFLLEWPDKMAPKFDIANPTFVSTSPSEDIGHGSGKNGTPVTSTATWNTVERLANALFSLELDMNELGPTCSAMNRAFGQLTIRSQNPIVTLDRWLTIRNHLLGIKNEEAALNLFSERLHIFLDGSMPEDSLQLFEKTLTLLEKQGKAEIIADPKRFDLEFITPALKDYANLIQAGLEDTIIGLTRKRKPNKNRSRSNVDALLGAFRKLKDEKVRKSPKPQRKPGKKAEVQIHLRKALSADTKERQLKLRNRKALAELSGNDIHRTRSVVRLLGESIA